MKQVYRIKEEGTYVDLSRITSISSIHDVEGSPFHPTIGFTITYIPDGIPFKQDNVNYITISKELPTPEEIREKHKTVLHPTHKQYVYTKEGEALIKEYREQETKKFEKVRKDLAEAWSSYRYLMQGGK